MMYLNDKETQQLAQKMLEWLKEDGFVFFRESCFLMANGKKTPKIGVIYHELTTLRLVYFARAAFSCFRKISPS